MADARAVPPTPEQIGQVVAAVRATHPLVHCITNGVVANVTANVLLAAGAAPAMVEAPEEAGVLAGVAGALLINLGTLTTPQVDGMRVAIAAANTAGVPWVLDPVAIGALPLRTAVAGEFARLGPAVIRGNASEIAALVGGAGGRGVDSTTTPDEITDVVADVAREFGTVVAASGPVDLITDGTRTVRVASGHPLLTRVTGVGCSLGALIGACLAVGDDAVLAAAAATAWMCVAGEQAAEKATGPGSFAVALLDGLDGLDPAAVGARGGVR
ncbi:hydroxyethylthiazole kinase [Nakamurella flavida]|uniref:Hydroxyethylthiazole kinase n=1 Tax=Nakamurella flavida TaxID=363630 RepID=A0A938YN03_9ACTN|nr:hydroxyethylthiazole kinase [Nakamurella flavida]MBM9476352.1 hydroxyethylthiazole kinase [Nakamurella flavida]MDP9779548.1 hydroxyethylthiazole kinase [Nakamurella flavida]